MASQDLSQRARIVKTAAQLFASRGYHAIGMSELQTAVQLGRGALYHHIRSKEDLLYDISREYITELAEHAGELRDEPDPRERVRTLGRFLLLKIASHQDELTVCFREVQALSEPRRSEVMALHTAYERVWKDALIEGADKGFFRPYDPVVLKGVLGMYFYSYLWMRPGGPLGPELIAERLGDMTTRMLALVPAATTA